jgi:hypothetical protein
LSGVRWISEPERKELAICACESRLPIQSLSRRVVLPDFDVQSPHAKMLAGGAHFHQRRLPYAGSTKGRLDKQIVQECVATTVLHTESQRHHYVSDILAFRLNEPNATKTVIRQKCRERLACALSIQWETGLFVELGHQSDERMNIVRCCQPDLILHGTRIR